MKKLVSIIIAAVIMFVFASCGSKTNGSDIVSGDKLEINFILDESKSTNSKLVVTTTLPFDTKVNITLKAGKDDFLLTEDTTVKGGNGANYIETSTLQRKDGSSLKEGRYILMIETKLPSEQSKEVVKYIGDDGSKMYGNDVYYSEGQQIAKINKVIELKSGHFENV